jgi:hypothetical protein
MAVGGALVLVGAGGSRSGNPRSWSPPGSASGSTSSARWPRPRSTRPGGLPGLFDAEDVEAAETTDAMPGEPDEVA